MSKMVDTRRQLRDALLELIRQRSWPRIQVQEICRRAGIARSTFYTHFAHKEELLVSGFDDLKRELYATRDPARSRGELAFLPGLVRHAAENRRMFRRLVASGAGNLPTAHFRLFILELVQEDLIGTRATNAHDALRVNYVAGALADSLIWWLQGRSGFDVNELCARCRALTQKALR